MTQEERRTQLIGMAVKNLGMNIFQACNAVYELEQNQLLHISKSGQIYLKEVV